VYKHGRTGHNYIGTGDSETGSHMCRKYFTFWELDEAFRISIFWQLNIIDKAKYKRKCYEYGEISIDFSLS
jgi:hypothetical protein